MTICQSDFKDKPGGGGWSVIYFTNTWGIKVIKSRFFNNSIAGNSQAVIAVRNSYGIIKCSIFYNNTANSNRGGVIRVDDGSLLYISNSTFCSNIVYRSFFYYYGVIIIFDTSHVIVESCTFKNNYVRSASVIRTNHRSSMLTLLATKFISNVGLLITPYFNRVIAECNDISVRRESTTITRSRRDLCKYHVPGTSAACNNSTCSACKL